MIVKTTTGERLEITKTHLTELDKSKCGEWNYQVTLPEIRKSYEKEKQTISVTSVMDVGAGKALYVTAHIREARIVNLGCCWFSIRTYNKILRAAGVKKIRGAK